MTVHVQLRILISDTSVIHVTSTSIEKCDKKGGGCCVLLKASKYGQEMDRLTVGTGRERKRGRI